MNPAPLGLEFEEAFLALLGKLIRPAPVANHQTGYAGLEGNAVYYLSLVGKPNALGGTLEVVYSVFVPMIQWRTRTYRVQVSQRGNALFLTVNGQRWTGERTRTGMTLNLPKTSSVSLTLNLETATRAEFTELLRGFKAGVNKRAREVSQG